jgi:hypothetical protein
MGGGGDGFSDEFGDSASITDWTEGPFDAFDALDIDTTTAGHLTVVLGQYNFWNDELQGFFLYKTVTGDFTIHVRTDIESIDNPGSDPTASFHAAGIMARDPSSDGGDESWVMYDLGRQNAITARGTRSANTAGSNTSFTLTASQNDATSGELIMCRLGDTFHLFRKLEGQTDWTETQTLDRGDLPQTMQVGVAANAGYAANPDLRATFDFARFTVPTTLAECTAGM